MVFNLKKKWKEGKIYLQFKNDGCVEKHTATIQSPIYWRQCKSQKSKPWSRN